MDDTTDPGPRYYFGYGSNLWMAQMHKRCPTSRYAGIARLVDYKWIINARGYANIVSTTNSDRSNLAETYGLIYEMQPSDEARLDVNEGVPEAYTKEMMGLEFWPTGKPLLPGNGLAPLRIEALVYIDRKRIEDDIPQREYIYRMNMGIKDALQMGIPQAYVERFIRKFISGDEDIGVEAFAMRQAASFKETAKES